jgi:hypothetical protein
VNVEFSFVHVLEIHLKDLNGEIYVHYNHIPEGGYQVICSLYLIVKFFGCPCAVYVLLFLAFWPLEQ